MSKRVIIIGAGGQGKVIADLVKSQNDEVLGFLDDQLRPGTLVLGIPVLGQVADYPLYQKDWLIAAIGDNRLRKTLAQKLCNVHWYTAIHPTAFVSDYAKIGEGTVVLPQAAVHTDAVIGRHCIINSGAVVEHDCRIGDYVHLSVGAKLGGGVTVGEGCFLGIGCAVRDHLHLAAGCVVGMGSVVVKDLTIPGVYTGVPAKRKGEQKANGADADVFDQPPSSGTNR